MNEPRGVLEVVKGYVSLSCSLGFVKGEWSRFHLSASYDLFRAAGSPSTSKYSLC